MLYSKQIQVFEEIINKLQFSNKLCLKLIDFGATERLYRPISLVTQPKNESSGGAGRTS